MILNFYKYHGNGNDFIMVNNINSDVDLSTYRISKICDRHFGIGGDGLISIESSGLGDFEMLYYNSDGNKGSMCGNGGRCAAAFAFMCGIVKEKMNFVAYDGIHRAEILNTNAEKTDFLVSLSM